MIQVSDHATLLKTNPRYAQLCKSIAEKWKTMDEEMETLAQEFPVENGFYCIWGDGNVRPTHDLTSDES
jgi:hypothetical protein